MAINCLATVKGNAALANSGRIRVYSNQRLIGMEKIFSSDERALTGYHRNVAGSRRAIFPPKPSQLTIPTPS